jgi:hypothetical protein
MLEQSYHGDDFGFLLRWNQRGQSSLTANDRHNSCVVGEQEDLPKGQDCLAELFSPSSREGACAFSPRLKGRFVNINTSKNENASATHHFRDRPPRLKAPPRWTRSRRRNRLRVCPPGKNPLGEPIWLQLVGYEPW